VGATLKPWILRSYRCVTSGMAANWGREGLASDSSYWTPCRGTSAAVTDSLVAVSRRRGDTSDVSDLALAITASRLVRHGVEAGLKRLARHQVVAEHVEWVLSQLGVGQLLLWGRGGG